MYTSASGSSIERNSSNPIQYSDSKSLSTKKLGSTQGTPNNNSALATWLEQANMFYSAVVQGQAPMPAQADWAKFLDEMQWTQTQLGITSNLQGNPDPTLGGNQDPNACPQIPAGAKLGSMGNIVFNSEKAETTYTPTSMPIDVLSDEFTLNVDTKVQDVTVEKTTDTRLNPAQDVLKITVKDPFSTPSETTYFVQAKAKININTIGGKGVTQHGTENLNLDDGTPQVNIGTFTGTDASNGANAESSLPGVADPKDPNTLIYKPDTDGDTIDFRAIAKKDTKHVVYSNANIAVQPGDQTDIEKIPNSDGSFDIQVTVTHPGTPPVKDVYDIKKGYTVQLNSNPEYVSIGGTAWDGKTIPADYNGKLTINSTSGTSSSGGAQGTGTVNTGQGASADAKVQAFLNTFQNPPVTFDDLKKFTYNGSATDLVDEIVNGGSKPSQAMLSFIFQHDNLLQSYSTGRNNLGLTNRLATILNALGDTTSTTVPDGYHQFGDVFHQIGSLLVVNGVVYNIAQGGPNVLAGPDPLYLNPITEDRT